MQRCLLLTVLILVMLAGCRKDAPVGPPDLLYKRWHLTQTRTPDSNVWQVRDTDAYYTVEYRPDGNMIYARNGVTTSANCCGPTQFNRQGVVITYTNWSTCPNVRCAGIKRATIRQLTDTALELNDGYTVSQYEAAN